ncbi:MAG TPA: EAL domain-containing protein [Mycobacteriales bacterium]|jgi:diguanylate cyclase (GGDEF)-like protein/PAS domain S-box-containing protein|nr:EAL domain-containing protein [Mycobacteriales bacterium]
MPDRQEPAIDPKVDTAARRAEVLAEHATDLALILHADADAVIGYVGPTVEPLFGYRSADVLGRSGWDFVHPDDEPDVRPLWDEVVATPGAHRVWETRVRRLDGAWVWVETHATNYLQDPAVGGVVVNLRDISDARTAASALAQREEFYRAILSAAQEGVWVVDPDGRTLFANEAMADILGVDIERLRAGAMWEFVDEETSSFLRSALRARFQGTPSRHELEFTRLDGVQRTLSISAVPLYGEGDEVRAAVGMCMDVTQRKKNERDLRAHALYDTLTGLPNRHLLSDRMAQACDRYERTGEDLSVLFIDIDRFTLVNDNFGHDAADAVLVKVARRLEMVCRDDDTLGRFGSDEFVVVCPGTDSYIGMRVAEAMRATFDEPFDIGDARVTLSASVGVASTQKVGPDDLLRSADRAAQRAKLNGRSRIELHDPAIRRAGHSQLELVTQLRNAIRTDQLALHYQPIVHADGHVAAVEALLRWTHPELGTISPIEAIAAAEDHGVMPDLGDWILRRACVDIAHLTVAPKMRVAVNLSTRQLVDGAIIASVERALNASGLAPGRLTLEVTETSLLVDTDATLAAMERLKALGLRIALDDFGTGYSSLSYLRAFPVDAIKIDRSFVAGMLTNRDDLAIVATLTNLAATVEMAVVAEGVETEEQAETIRRLGVTYGQGFLWSPAVPLAELPDLLHPGRFGAMPRAASARRPRKLAPAVAEDSDRARIIALHRSGASPTTIAAALNADGRLTLRGTRWQRNTIARVIAEDAYPDLAPAKDTPGSAVYPSDPQRSPDHAEGPA